jgi:hypothetical protein
MNIFIPYFFEKRFDFVRQINIMLIHNLINMTTKEKLFTKFLKSPKSLKYKEIEVFLLKNGFSFERGK